MLLSLALALAAQFLALPILIGAKRGGEAIGWTLILGIFFALPSAGIYLLLFAILYAAAPPPVVTVLVGSLVPAALAAAFYWKKEGKKVFGRNKYVVRMLLVGGLAGSLSLSGLLWS